MNELGETELLKLAARASGAGRLERPDGTAKVRNPFCGDRLTLDVRIEGGRVAEIGYEIRACLVCQASASIAGQEMVGRPAAEIADSGAAVESFLKGEGDAPVHYGIFEPMQPHLNRHVCVMMPFQAIAEAVEDADSGD
ncbi:MAG: iron-sulfur cluster assembly scaffold protein [Minwuia sp.]|uniref:iron-sulfur cluster assembly scaffold protein n=1 Tax=Minwuia sp. TaxID=2493630 RepID=UPI003A84A49D